jgi:ribosomal protein S19
MPPNATTVRSAIATVDSRSVMSTPHTLGFQAIVHKGRGGTFRTVRVEVGQDHGGTGLGERAAVHLADGATAAGDDGDLAVEPEALDRGHAPSVTSRAR